MPSTDDRLPTPQFELWYGTVHRPLDAHTPAQAVTRGRAFATRYRFPNIHEVRIMHLLPGQPPQVLATVRPWHRTGD